jgi:phytoene dehydrogenase-like protein
MSDVDAVIVGGGHNGLVAAAVLARGGWSVLLLEKAGELGGAVKSGEITRPGFVHDLYSTNQGLFLGSEAYRDFRAELERHGLAHAVADRAAASVFPGGRALRLFRDLDRTLDGLRAHDDRDAEGFMRLRGQHRRFQASLAPLLQAELPSGRAAAQLASAAARVGVPQLLEVARTLVSSAREVGDEHFGSPEMKAMFASWGLHLDFGPDVPLGAMFPFIETFSAVENGMAVAVGGAGNLPRALAAVARGHGAEIRTGADVARIEVRDGRAVGVVLADGERIGARRAVVANLSPGPLIGRLLADADVPAGVLRRAEAYRYGPATMTVHLAMDGPIPWEAGEDLAGFGYVHAAPHVEDLSRTYSQAMDGLIPDSPLLIVGHTSAVDPSRAPAGGHVVWIQVRCLPSAIRGDAAGTIGARDWDAAREAVADRVVDKLEGFAPGTKARILDRAVLSPADLERDNPNLVGGDSIAGSHHPRQHFVFRPFPGWSRYRTPVEGLWMVGASTWPGAGVNAASGYMAAQDLLRSDAVRRTARRGGAALATAGLAAVAGAAVARRAMRRR